MLAQAETKYTISGYILDQNGQGIANAEIIFNVPTIVPAAFSDSTGHYAIYAPAGTYHVNVWPPFDSNYVNYDQQSLTINGDLTKNVTLNTGYKVSGYIRDSTGKPVQGAVAALNNYCCGWYSDSSGHYFVTAPAGTYTFNIHPRQGLTFPTYIENSLSLTGDTTKDITLATSETPTPSPAYTKISGYIRDSNGVPISDANVIFNVPSIVPSVWTNQAGYYEIYAPAGTYHVNVWPPYNSNYINYDEPGFAVGTSSISKNIILTTGCKVSGYLVTTNGAPVVGAVVLLDNFGSGWFSDSNGYYFLNVPAGTYAINAHPRSGYNYSGPTTNFQGYYETNFVVQNNVIKNITVSLTSSGSSTTSSSSTTSNNQGATQSQDPTQTPTSTPTQSPSLGAVSDEITQQVAETETNVSSDLTLWIAIAIGFVVSIVAVTVVGLKTKRTAKTKN